MNRRQMMQRTAATVGLAALVSGDAVESQTAGPSAGTMPWTEIHPGIWKARLASPEAYTPVSSRLVAPAVTPLAHLPHISAPPIVAPNGRVTARGCLVQLPLEPFENLYGFGLQMLSFAQRGKKKTMRVNADPKVDTGDSHAPVPFYVSTRGYGVFVDSCRHVDFYCGNARKPPVQPAVDVSGAEVHTPGSTRTLPLEASGAITIEVPRARGVDVYLFAGPTMIDVVKRYNLFSGGGLEPPAWGLGFWYRAEGQSDQKAILRTAIEFRQRKIPCDVLGLEPGWQTHAYSCSFVWDATRFPDPAGFLLDAGRLNFKVNLWEHAFTHPSSPLFAPLGSHAGDYGVWGGLVPDFAAAPAREIFGDYHGTHLIDLGVSGFKLDECDSSDFTHGWSFPDFSSFPSGVDGEQMHAVFGLRYQQTIWQQFQQRRKQTFGLVRSSGALAAPYPFVLYSDLYEHRDFVRALVNSGFSGLLWCPEVRDASSEEDLVRRLETVVFSPLAMVNAWYIKNPPWKQIDRDKNNAGEFAAGWESLEARARTIIGWRMELIPYLQSAFAQYAADGTPPFRALILDYPDDPAMQAVDDQYMIGDRMLVAPFFAGEKQRKVVLPKGRWHDLWTGSTVEGGRTLSIVQQNQPIRVFVKEGSVLPVATIGDSSESVVSKQLTVRVYGDGSLAWHRAGSNGLTLSWNAGTGKGEVKSASKPHGYNVIAWKQMGAS
jgi:alpha-D-xyloside xylohydrolase